MSQQFLHGVEVIQKLDGIRPISINFTAPIGLIGTAPDADPAVFPYDMPVLLSSEPRQAAMLGKLGTLAGALNQIWAEGGATIVVVRVKDVLEGPTIPTNPAFVAGTISQQLSLIIGDPVLKTGVHAFKTAAHIVGIKPKTLIAPGFTSQRPGNLSNPVVAALIPIAEALRGRIYMDAPSGSQVDALAARMDFGSRRVNICWPNVEVWDETLSGYVSMPSSATRAGLTARVHAKEDYWYSSSNHEVYGIGGLATPVYFAPGDINCDANLLNAGNISTFIKDGDGWRFWGNRTTSTDPLWAFESVCNTSDAIADALEVAERWMVDKPFSRQLLLDGAASINGFLRYLVKIGALVGGHCYLDPELNPPAQIQSGVFQWSVDYEPPAPLEHIIVNMTRNGNYYKEVVTQIAAEIASQV